MQCFMDYERTSPEGASPRARAFIIHQIGLLTVTKVASVRYPGLATRLNACINITKAHLISVFLSDTELQSFLTDI